MSLEKSLSDSNVYVFGQNVCGCLGLGGDEVFHGGTWKEVHTPVRFHVDNITWAQIECGGYVTVALSNNGEVFTCGTGQFYQLGHGDRNSRNVPTKVEIPGGEKIVKVACGFRHAAALTGDGKLFTW